MLVIRRATSDQLPDLLRLVMEAVGWLADQGSDQWQYPEHVQARTLSKALARGHIWIIEDSSGQAIATITLNDYADPEFWTPEDDPDSALYAHRMTVSRAYAGHELGSAILDWAGRKAVQAGKKWLRLDAWATNTALQRYYLSHGFYAVRILHFPHRGSGALFERLASVSLGLGPNLIEAASSVQHR